MSNCLFSLWGCVPTEPHFERLFINFRAVLYGLAENYTQAFGPTEKTSFPHWSCPYSLSNKWFSTTLFTLGLTLIGLTHELSSEQNRTGAPYFQIMPMQGLVPGVLAPLAHCQTTPMTWRLTLQKFPCLFHYIVLFRIFSLTELMIHFLLQIQEIITKNFSRHLILHGNLQAFPLDFNLQNKLHEQRFF